MGAEPFQRLKTVYYGKSAADRKEELLEAIRNKKAVPGLCLITFASNGIDQLDILPFFAAMQKHVLDRRPVLAGICLGRQEAFETVAQMAADAYRETGSCHLQSFLLRKEKGGVTDGGTEE